jgi:hypothetical protein
MEYTKVVIICHLNHISSFLTLLVHQNIRRIVPEANMYYLCSILTPSKENTKRLGKLCSILSRLNPKTSCFTKNGFSIKPVAVDQ